MAIVIVRERQTKLVRVHHVSKDKVIVDRAYSQMKQMVYRPTWVTMVHIRHRRIREDPNSESTSWVRKWLEEEEYFDAKRKRKVWGVMKRDVTEEEARRWVGVL